MSTYSNRIRDNQRRSRAKKMGYIEYLQAAPEKANEEKQKRIDEKQHLHLLLGQYGHSPNDMSNDDVSPTPKLEDVRGCDAGKQAQPRNLLQGSQIGTIHHQIPDIKHINIATEPKLLDLWPVAQETSFHHTERALQRAYGLGISPTQLEIPQQMDKFSNTYTQSLSDDKYMQKTYRLDSFLTQIPWDDEAFQQMDEFNSNCTQSLSDDKSIQETCGLSSCPTQLQMPLDDEASRQMPLIQPNLALASAKPQLILQQALGRNVLPGPCRPKKTRKPRKFLTIEEKQQICQTAQETPSLKRVEIADMFYITKRCGGQ
ncbi:hypothetical protein V495_00188 [Pseudogymnoascus sp. VKM F-4514 (FW-929)]|nr:hypothetical protein V495_00188 [Pseudogymnoascus sp. VKM F-4514 (FW-929)]KFY67306.1 hypothetical protein V497_00419 [Pseudogymnoascus sp. VKM F-4516 (FW-969)]